MRDCCNFAHAEPALESAVYGEKKFCNEKVVQSNVVSKSFLVASDDDEKLPETGCTNALFAKKRSCRQWQRLGVEFPCR